MTHWFSSVLQKSFDALELVRNDLSEFRTTVKNDTETYFNQWMRHSEKKSIGKQQNTNEIPGSDHEKSLKLSKPLDRILNDSSTFLNDPEPVENYECWRQTTNFNVEIHENEISQLLIDVPQLRSFYAHFVPTSTSHEQFWSRYFYRREQIQQEENRRTQLLKRVEQICQDHEENQSINTDWEHSDDELWPSDQQRTDHDAVSADSWVRDFDETELHQTKILSSPNETTQRIENQSDDEWESWS